MMKQNKYEIDPNNQVIIHQLGLWYSVYRMILACSLLIVFLFTYGQLRAEYESTSYYFGTCLTYLLISFIQFFTMRTYKVGSAIHLYLLFLVDIIAFSNLSYALYDGVNVSIGLLFTISILLASILLNSYVSLFLMLLATILLTYQTLLLIVFDISKLKILGNNLLLFFFFVTAHTLGRMATERFKLLERTALSKTIELERLQRINQHILQKMEVGYLVLNEKMEIIMSNPMASRLLGFPNLISSKQYPLELWQPEFFEYLKNERKEDYKMIHQDLFKQKNQNIRFEYYCERTHYKIDIKMQALNASHEVLTLFTLRDMQEIHQQVQQLKLASLGQLSASIAHEIRNPLSAIVQANDLLADELTEDQQMFSQMITKQSKRIDQIIHNTLNMAKQENIIIEHLNLSEFIPQLLTEDLNDIQLHIQLEIMPNLCLLFDKGQLRQVLINLLRNAMRHNSPNKPLILRAFLVERECWLDVIDFGEGVSREEQRNLFKPFFSTALNGTGLGLYLSHSFCEANQAKLVYVDEPEQGACFRIMGVGCVQECENEDENACQNDS